MLDRLRALIERFIPWYDPKLEAERNARTEDIRKRSIAVRVEVERRLAGAEQIRAAYQAYADRLEGR